VVDNQTDEEWVLGWGADVPIGYAVPAGESGIVLPFGPDPSELILLDRECGEVHRLDWDGSATGVRIVEPGTMFATDDLPDDTTFILTEVWECTEDTFDAAPTPGEALPEAGGTIHLASPNGSSYTLDVASATMTRLGVATDDLTVENAWSPDGRQVAFVRSSLDEGMPSLFLADIDGNDPDRLVDNAVSPRWSPDGRHIAYLDVDPFATSTTLGIVELESGDVRQLAADASSPSWSPDGRWLAFVATTAPNGPAAPMSHVRIVNVDGSGLETVADAALYAEPPSWSPDGTRLAFSGLPADATARDPGLDVLAVHDLAAGETSVLAAIDGTALGEPAWSPDGETIAFTMESAGLFAASAGLATVPASGGTVTRLREGPGAPFFLTPIWSPDGAWVAATRLDEFGLDGSLIAVRADATEEVVLATGVLAAIEWRADVR
jgi:dipeptidyl aminopeptidase/acylaminoacyl peptidase